MHKEQQKDEWRKPCLFTSDIQKWTVTSGWNEAQFGILFCEPVCFFFSSVVRSSCQDFSVIITDKNVFFRSCWSSLIFDFLGLSRCVFVPKFSVSNYLSFPFCLFQIGSYFPFRHFPCLVLSFFLDRIQNLCFPSRSIRYGFEQSRLISQARGFITWLEFLSFSYLLRKPSTIWRETYRLKNPETGVLGTRKLEPGNTAVKLRFRSEDDYPVRNIDEPVRLSNEPARIGDPVRLRNEPVRVVKNPF